MTLTVRYLSGDRRIVSDDTNPSRCWEEWRCIRCSQWLEEEPPEATGEPMCPDCSYRCTE
jgi:DNA-directed RNA polymerase subunit RPC12/RpoP